MEEKSPLTDKLKVGMYWGAGCGGCDISLLEIHENILDLIEAIDIVFWPCILDFKYADVEKFADREMDACFFNGAIRTEENIQIARLLRSKTKLLVAYGACASMGGIPALANLHSLEEILERTFVTTESTENPDRIVPLSETAVGKGNTLTLPPLERTVGILGDYVQVDYSIPGCPPVEHQVAAVFNGILSNELPPKGSIIGAGNKSVCDECALEKVEDTIAKYRRPHQVIADGKTCLLRQGIICMGPATRSGCKASCLSVNMPCRGCYGATENVSDQGARMAGMLGSLIGSLDEEKISSCIEEIVDPTGTLYRFGFCASILGRGRRAPGR